MKESLASWDSRYTQAKTNEILLEIASVLARRLPEGSHRERISGLCRTGHIRDLCDLQVDYSDPRDVCTIVRQIRALFEKRRDLELGVDTSSVAIDTFMATEALCQATNDIFRKRSQGSFSFEPSVELVLYHAQRKIAEILDDVPRLSDLRVRFGPGATSGTKKKNAAPRVKLGTPFSCSRDLAPYIDAVLGECPGWIPFTDEDQVSVPVEIDIGRVVTVPKSWKTDRAICVEPVLNGFVQNGLGDYIAHRLKLFGIDISDQSRNQQLAMLGSISGELATLDLSSASDCISTSLIWDLLSPDWAESLSACRTSRVEIVSKEGRIEMQLQKFSTMGNGFTFPLETLIFYGLGYGVLRLLGLSPKNLSVYGDDIIIPVQGYDLMSKVLRCVGFIPNASKSFASGPFRESCGTDYYSGFNIRPIYVKDSLSGESLFVLHNGFRRRFDDELADIVLSHIPTHLRLFGPDGYGDGCLLPAFGVDPPLVPHGRQRGWGGYTFEVFTRKPRSLTKLTMPGDRYLPVYSIYATGSSGDIDSVSRVPPLFSKTRLYVPSRVYLSEPKVQNCSYKGDKLSVPLPGSNGYRRIKIYTLGL